MHGQALRVSVLVAVGLGLWSSNVLSQEKISQRVQDQIAQDGFARILVKMKEPIPGQAASAAFSEPSGYLSNILSDKASNVSSISDLPAAVAEVDAADLQRIRNDPNVLYVFADVPMALPTPGEVIEGVNALARKIHVAVAGVAQAFEMA